MASWRPRSNHVSVFRTVPWIPEVPLLLFVLRSARRYILMLLALAPFTCSAFAQLNNDPTIETGMKAYGSFEGGSIDSISTTNGNLNLHIPLVSFPQIGGNLHLGFYVNLSNGNYQYTPNTVSSCTQSPYVCEYGTYDNGSFVSIVPDFGLTAYVSGVIPPPYGAYAEIKTPDGSLHEVGATSTGWRSNDTTGFL